MARPAPDVTDRLRGRAEVGPTPGVSGPVAGVLLLAVLSAAVHADPGIDSPAYWAPVIIQHQGQELVDSYPVPFGDDGSGEFTVYHWQHTGADRRWLGYFWQYADGSALAAVLDIETNEPAFPTGLVLAGVNGCQWQPAAAMRRVRDSVGLHPVVSVKNHALTLELGDLERVLPDSGVVDWTDLPRRGRQFPRAWQRQSHLAQGTPATFGVVLRHEPEGGFRLGSRRGQGNMPHHWNLIAYRLDALPVDDPRLRNHPGDPLQWPCAGIFSDPGGTIERLRREHAEQ